MCTIDPASKHSSTQLATRRSFDGFSRAGQLPLAAALASVCADGLPAPFTPPFIIPVAWRTALA